MDKLKRCKQGRSRNTELREERGCNTCLRTAFMLADPKSAKRQSSHQFKKSWPTFLLLYFRALCRLLKFNEIDPWSQSYHAFFLHVFQISLSSLTVCNIKKLIWYKMPKNNRGNNRVLMETCIFSYWNCSPGCGWGGMDLLCTHGLFGLSLPGHGIPVSLSSLIQTHNLTKKKYLGNKQNLRAFSNCSFICLLSKR